MKKILKIILILVATLAVLRVNKHNRLGTKLLTIYTYMGIGIERLTDSIEWIIKRRIK